MIYWLERANRTYVMLCKYVNIAIVSAVLEFDLVWFMVCVTQTGTYVEKKIRK